MCVCQSVHRCVSDAFRVQKRVLQSLGVGIIGISKIADVDAGTCTLVLMVEQQVLLNS